MNRDRIHIALAAAAVLAASIHGCGPSTKVRRLAQEAPAATLRLAKEETAAPEVKLSSPHRDTLKVEDIDGKEVFKFHNSASK